MKAVAQVFAFDLAAKVVLAAAGVFVIRALSRGEYAQYTFAAAVVGVVSQVLGGTVNRMYIVGHDRLGVSDPISASLSFQLTAVTAATLLSLPLLLAYPVMGSLVVALVVASCLSDFAKTVFQREMKFLRFSLVEFSRAAVFLAVLVAIAVARGDRLRAWQVLGLQSGAMLLVFLLAVGRRVRWRSLLNLRQAGTLGRGVVRGRYGFLVGYFVVLALLSQANVPLLRVLAGSEPLAAYGAAFRYYGLLLLALGAVNQVLLPSVQAADAAALHALLRQNARFTVVFAAGVLLGISLAPWALPLLDGGKYPDAVPVFQVLAFSTIPSLAFSPYVNLLMRREDFGFLFVLVGVALATNLLLGVWLIPGMGALGAALAYVVAFTLLNGTIFLRARGEVRHREVAAGPAS